MVVFDEASQIRVADAVGAMGRARSVVVVRDSKQMPPTSFGGVGLDDTDADVDHEVDAGVPEDEESILSECVQGRVPRRWLSWHYRSQDEALIVFSRRHYYEGRLASSSVDGEAGGGGGGHAVLSVRRQSPPRHDSSRTAASRPTTAGPCLPARFGRYGTNLVTSRLMTSPSVPVILEQVRHEFGPRFVAARVEAENDARRLLERAGRMTRDDFVELGSTFNRHEVSGVVKRNRFTPAFTGYSILRVSERIDDLNEAMRVLWGPSEEDALALVGRVLQVRSELPGAGSSLLTMLMYLRDPERFGIQIDATMGGLRLANSAAQQYRAFSGEGYGRFCEDLLTWRQEWDVAPQEHDAVLTALLRASRPSGGDPTPEPRNKLRGPTAPNSTRTADVARACHLSVETVDGWVAALTEGRLRQAFFHGPPGTGKTWVAQHLASYLATSPEHVHVVQFHPAFSYEDFVEGLRPEVDGNSGGLTYTVRPGLFRALCAKAAAAPEEKFVLVVDEMNRADLAAVFGELLLLLEYRGRSVQLPYSHKQFAVPENLLLLGTMNTADRSLALVDFALRRRFHAFALRPDRDVLSSWLESGDAEASSLSLRVFDLIADRVGVDPAAPGHSYWMGSGDAATLERTWTFQVHPYLAELWFDRPERLEDLDREVRLLLGEGS